MVTHMAQEEPILNPNSEAKLIKILKIQEINSQVLHLLQVLIPMIQHNQISSNNPHKPTQIQDQTRTITQTTNSKIPSHRQLLHNPISRLLFLPPLLRILTNLFRQIQTHKIVQIISNPKILIKTLLPNQLQLPLKINNSPIIISKVPNLNNLIKINSNRLQAHPRATNHNLLNKLPLNLISLLIYVFLGQM